MLVFQRTTFFRGIVLNEELGFGKDAAYELLENPRYNRRSFMLKLASMVCRFFDLLTNEGLEKVYPTTRCVTPRYYIAQNCKLVPQIRSLRLPA